MGAAAAAANGYDARGLHAAAVVFFTVTFNSRGFFIGPGAGAPGILTPAALLALRFSKGRPTLRREPQRM